MFKFLDNFNRSPKWTSVRKEHIKNYPTCAACGSSKNLDVHHIIPYHINPSLELDPNNLITLCSKYCHFTFGHFMDWKSWNINVKKDAEKYLILKNNRPYTQIFGSQNKGTLYEIFTTITNYANRIIGKCWNNRPQSKR